MVVQREHIPNVNEIYSSLEISVSFVVDVDGDASITEVPEYPSNVSACRSFACLAFTNFAV